MTTELALVDLSYLMHRTWHSTPSTEPGSAVHDRVVERVRGIASRYQHLAVCCDSPRNWRHDLYDGYKAQRPEKNPALLAQLLEVQETLRRDGFPVWLVDGFEGDDMIATAAALTKARDAETRVVILTADKDLMQLVDTRVSVHNLNSNLDMGPDDVSERYAVKPEQIADWLALMGDASDNIPGVPGIGEKTAALMIGKWKSLAGVIAAAEDETSEMKPAARKAILAHLPDIAMSRRLVGLRTDAPIEIEEAFKPRVTAPLKSAEGDSMANDTSEEETTAQQPEAPPSEPETRGGEVVRMQPTQAAPTPLTMAGDTTPAPTASAIVAAPHGGDQWSHALEPVSAHQAYRMAATIHNSRLFGSMPNADAVFATIMFGRSLGLGAMTSLRSVHLIEGKLTLSAQAIVGLVLKSGMADYFKLVEETSERATWKTHRRGDPDREATSKTFTIKDAETAGYLRKGGNWLKIPSTMLRWRAATELARAVYPDVVGGLYDPEELREHAREERAA